MDVVTFGETMIVMNPEHAGSVASVDVFRKDFAGAESNVAIGLARLGHRVAWISRLGQDGFGQYIHQSLHREGIDVSGVRFDAEHKTGLYFKELTSSGCASVHYYRAGSAASHLQPDDVRLERFEGANYLFITGITPALSLSCGHAIRESIKQARDLNMKIVFDPNIRLKLWSPHEAREVIEPLMGASDIVIPGIEEARLLSGCTAAQDCSTYFLEAGAGLVVIKLGGRDGAYYQSSAESGYVPSFPVARVDEIGAGDAFDAGLISGLLDGLDLADCVRRGCALGALAVTRVGDHAALPNRQQLDSFLSTAAQPAG